MFFFLRDKSGDQFIVAPLVLRAWGDEEGVNCHTIFGQRFYQKQHHTLVFGALVVTPSFEVMERAYLQPISAMILHHTLIAPVLQNREPELYYLFTNLSLLVNTAIKICVGRHGQSCADLHVMV